jgi:hypothetical protein
MMTKRLALFDYRVVMSCFESTRSERKSGLGSVSFAIFTFDGILLICTRPT